MQVKSKHKKAAPKKKTRGVATARDERHDKMEDAVLMVLGGKRGSEIIKTLGIGYSTLVDWKNTDVWKAIVGKLRAERKLVREEMWWELKEEVSLYITRIREMDEPTAQHVETLKFIAEGLGMASEGEGNGNKENGTGPPPIAIQINTTEQRAALTTELRSRLGSRATAVDGSEK